MQVAIFAASATRRVPISKTPLHPTSPGPHPGLVVSAPQLPWRRLPCLSSRSGTACLIPHPAAKLPAQPLIPQRNRLPNLSSAAKLPTQPANSLAGKIQAGIPFRLAKDYFNAASCSAVSPVNSVICSAGIPAASIFLATSALPSAIPSSLA